MRRMYTKKNINNPVRAHVTAIQCYSDIASPLYKLTKKDVPFIWSNEAEVAFANLKEILINTPV